jgi:hypothetical protein
MHIICQHHNNVLIYQLLHVSGLTGPSSESAQLLKTITQPFYRLQYVAELSQIHQCVIYSRWICAQ